MLRDTGHFECNNCKQRFKSNQALFTHRRKVHLGLQDDKTKGTIVCKFKDCTTTFKHEKGHKHHYTTVHKKLNWIKIKNKKMIAMQKVLIERWHGFAIYIYILGRLKKFVSSQTIFLRSATTFSHYLGLKHCRKPKIENFYEFFHPDGALRSFTT